MLNAYKESLNETNQNMTSKCNTTPWIIDSGASNHMIGNLKNICDIRDIQGCLLGLPKGESTLSTKKGEVVLDGGLKLTNVLYVPKLHCS
jgi:hypothetical protein